MVERKGGPPKDEPGAPTEEPPIFFPGAKESDHNESADGEDYHQMKGDSKDHLSYLPGEGGGIRGRQAGRGPGVYDTLGVGGGGRGKVRGGIASGGYLVPDSKPAASANKPIPPGQADSDRFTTTGGELRDRGGRPEAGTTPLGGRPEVGATRDGRSEAGAAEGKPAQTEMKRFFGYTDKAGGGPAGPGANRELAESSRREAESRAKPAAEAAARGEVEYRSKTKEEAKEKANLVRQGVPHSQTENDRKIDNLKRQAGLAVLALEPPQDMAKKIEEGDDRVAGRELAQHERLAKALEQLKEGEKRPAPEGLESTVTNAAEPPAFVRLTADESGRDKDKATFSLDEPRTPGIDERLKPRDVPKAQEAHKELQQQARESEPDESLPSASFFKAGPVNPWVLTNRDRFSTFALAVDTASYTLARRFLQKGFLPPAASVRMEELINAFDYNYPGQTSDVFAIHVEGAPSPFRPNLTLLKVGVKGKVLGREGRKPAHLVFVIDGSGSMARPDRLPLIQYALRGLAGQLGPADRVSVVVFGTEARLAAEAVPAARRAEILAAIDSVQPAGPTNLLLGLQLGYAVAQRQFRVGEINRVILCTDGVANIGSSDADEMLGNVKAYRDQGVTFTAAGFGTGSYNDALLARLAAQGDGRYVFIDSAAEARRVFVEEMAATLQSIAVDAKIQVEFDPARVRRYRLIGYEARAIRDEDFRNDAIEAAEVGSGQSATALYEVELADDGAWMAVDDVRAGTSPAPRRDAIAGCPVPAASLGTVFVRYRNADTGKIEEIAKRVEAGAIRRRTAEESPRFLLAAAVAELAELLRESEYAQGSDYPKVAAVLAGVARQLPLDKKVKEIADLAARAQGLSRAQ